MDTNQFAKMLSLDTEDQIENASLQSINEFIEFACRCMELDPETFARYVALDIRTRLIQHFIPAKIVRKKNSDTARLIRNDIRALLLQILAGEGLDAKEIRPIEDVIQKCGSTLLESRTNTASVDDLLDDFPTCRICGHNFKSSTNPSTRADKYDCLKPSSKKAKLRQPEVEHWICVSRFGTNKLDNLCLCCSQCNSGKTDYISYSESRYSSGYRRADFLKADNKKIEPGLFYSVVMRDRRCKFCNKNPNETELTIKPRRTDFFFLFDNLVTTCYDCDDYEARWVKRPEVATADIQRE